MQNVLIIGINGFVGSYLADEFSSNGYKVLGSDRSKACKVETVSFYREADLCDAEAVGRLVEDCEPEIIVNLAAVSSVGKSWDIPRQVMSVNVIGTLNILEAVREQGRSPKILLVGSSEEYAPSGETLNEKSERLATNPYGISKIAQDQFAYLYCKQYGLRIYRTRSFNHTGIGQADTFVLPSFCRQAARIDVFGEPSAIEVGNLEVYRDFSDVRDVVHAYRLIVESDYVGEVFNVGSGQAYSLKYLLDTICSFSVQNIHVVVDKERSRPADNERIVCDPSKLKRLLGWNPRFEITETLRSMFDYYKAQL